MFLFMSTFVLPVETFCFRKTPLLSHFYRGAKIAVKGAKKIHGMLICIKIGSITHLRSIGLIRYVLDLCF